MFRSGVAPQGHEDLARHRTLQNRCCANGEEPLWRALQLTEQRLRRFAAQTITYSLGRGIWIARLSGIQRRLRDGLVNGIVYGSEARIVPVLVAACSYRRSLVRLLP